MNKLICTLLIGLMVRFGYGQPELQNDFDVAIVLLKSKNYQKAAEAFTDVLNKASEDKLKKFCYIYRAFSYNGLGNYKSSIADLNKAIELDPDDLASYTDRGKAKAFSDDLDGAKKDFLFILTKDSIEEQGQAALYYLAKIEYQLTNYEKSIEYYDRHIFLTPNDPELYFNRGATKGMLMNMEGAIKDYDKAIELKPDYMEAYANRGVAKINLLTNGNISPTEEQTSDACSDLKKAKELGDNYVDDMISVHCNEK